MISFQAGAESTDLEVGAALVKVLGSDAELCRKRDPGVIVKFQHGGILYRMDLGVSFETNSYQGCLEERESLFIVFKQWSLIQPSSSLKDWVLGSLSQESSFSDVQWFDPDS